MLDPYWSDDTVSLYVGDCRKVLAEMADASVDAVVCDPPYNLSVSSKRDLKCLRRIIAEFSFPYDQEGDAERRESRDLALPSLGRADLGGVHRPVRVVAGIGVPESAVDLQCTAVAEHEIKGGDISTLRTSDGYLPLIGDTETIKGGGNYVLQLADAGNTPFCDSTCSCFTEPSTGFIAVTVALSSATARDLAGSDFWGQRWGDEDVRLGDDALSQSEGAPLVVTDTGAVVRAVLRLDLRRGTGELRPANGAHEGDPVLLLTPSHLVGAASGAAGLAAELKPARIRLIGDSTDGTFTLYFPWHEIHFTGPTGGFMGKEWDGWESPASFQRWCLAWARECLRVLKPGGHLLAFGAPRTYHRLAVAIEDAGFEIRDSIHWIFGTGFPKGQDVAKTIDRRRDDQADVLRVTAWLAAARDAAGWTNVQIDALWGYSGMGGLWTTQGKAAIVPRPDQWNRLRDAIGFDDTEIRPLVVRLNERKGSPGEAWTQREVIGTRNAPERKSDHLYGVYSGDDRLTAPASDPARQWQGWNTSLKPAHEPIVLARKSTGFNSTVANVLEYGTGALNIAACRVEPTGESRPRTDEASQERRYTDKGGTDFAPLPGVRGGAPEGRWPANLIFSHSASCVEDGPCDQETCPVAELDRQSGQRTSGKMRAGTVRGNRDGWAGPMPATTGAETYGDSGGASRYFPVFRYEAKAGSAERPKLDDGTAHSTVKPLELMRFLVRLVTPPGGTVLDPFAGSGTTGEACVLEGFQSVLIELEQPHAELIKRRLSKPLQPSLFGEVNTDA